MTSLPISLLAAAVILAMLGIGIAKLFEWELESRIIGGCTVLWAAGALLLFIFQWLPMREPGPYSLVTITLLSTVGIIVGRTLVALIRYDWMADLMDRRPANQIVQPTERLPIDGSGRPSIPPGSPA